jgi:hypothetical protein
VNPDQQPPESITELGKNLGRRRVVKRYVNQVRQARRKLEDAYLRLEGKPLSPRQFRKIRKAENRRRRAEAREARSE